MLKQSRGGAGKSALPAQAISKSAASKVYSERLGNLEERG